MIKNQIVVSRAGLSKKQLQFLDAPEDESLFGGARGGGKTHVVRVGAVEDCLMHPGRNVIFVRPTIKSAKNQFGVSKMSSIIPRSYRDEDGKKHEIWRINKQDGYYEFANGPDPDNPFDGGSQLILGGITTLQDAQDNYQGIEFVSIWWDELTKANYPAVEYLKGSLRDVTYRTKFRAASNPGERGHKEVKAAYVTPWAKVRKYKGYDKTFTGKLSWFRDFEDEKTGKVFRKTFSYIPATIHDNPMQNVKENYIKQLLDLPKHLKEMYLNGSWDTYEGKFWDDVDSDSRYIKKEELAAYGIDFEEELKHSKTYLSMDWGYSDSTAIYWHLETSKGNVITYNELFVNKLLMEEVALMVEKENKSLGVKPVSIYTPWDIYVNRGSKFQSSDGEILGEDLIDVWRHYSSVPDIKASQDRKQGWQNMTKGLKQFTTFRYLENGTANSKEIPLWLILKDKCYELVEEIEAAQVDDKNPNDITLTKDHAIDSCRMFWVAHLIHLEEIRKEETPAEGTGAWYLWNIKKKNEEKAKKRRQSTLFIT